MASGEWDDENLELLLLVYARFAVVTWRKRNWQSEDLSWCFNNKEAYALCATLGDYGWRKEVAFQGKCEIDQDVLEHQHQIAQDNAWRLER